jgi:hypothetical protein
MIYSYLLNGEQGLITSQQTHHPSEMGALNPAVIPQSMELMEGNGELLLASSMWRVLQVLNELAVAGRFKEADVLLARYRRVPLPSAQPRHCPKITSPNPSQNIAAKFT